MTTDKLGENELSLDGIELALNVLKPRGEPTDDTEQWEAWHALRDHCIAERARLNIARKYVGGELVRLQYARDEERSRIVQMVSAGAKRIIEGGTP